MVKTGALEKYLAHFRACMHRCFYEIILENRACKAYFDLEAGPGAMTKEEGAGMCNEVVREWAARIRTRWPNAKQDCKAM